jgi:phosphoribosylamine---glycine ligase
LAAAEGRLSAAPVALSNDRFVGVVLASRGYPGPVDTGQVIDGLEAAGALPRVTVFHAGTATKDGRIVTSGGRVLTVVGRGPSFPDAIAAAYRGVDAIHFDGMQYRRDIGKKVV